MCIFVGKCFEKPGDKQNFFFVGKQFFRQALLLPPHFGILVSSFNFKKGKNSNFRLSVLFLFKNYPTKPTFSLTKKETVFFWCYKTKVQKTREELAFFNSNVTRMDTRKKRVFFSVYSACKRV